MLSNHSCSAAVAVAASRSQRVGVHLVAVEWAADVPHAVVAAAALAVAAAVEAPRHLLLLRRLLEPLLNDSEHLCRFHGIVRLSEQCAPLPVK